MMLNSRSTISILAPLFALAAVVASAPVAASAAEVAGVTSVTIQPPDPAHPDAPLTDGQRVAVDVTWSVPDGTQTGDTFTLAFPAEIRAFAAQFDLLDPTGAVVGNCVVATPDFLCTMNDYVMTHTSVHGGLRFFARASGTITADTVPFTPGVGPVIPAALPGGAIVGPTGNPSLPTRPSKYGYLKSVGNVVEWTVTVPGASAAPVGGQPAVFTDTYDSTLALVPSSFTARAVPAASWTTGDNWPNGTALSAGTGPNTYTFTADAATSSLRFAFNNAVTDGSVVYMVRYSTTIPAGTASGTVFANSVVAPNGVEVARAQVSYLGASGEGVGVPPVTPPPTPPVTPPVELPTLALPDSDLAADGSEALAETGPQTLPLARLALALLVVGAAGLLAAPGRSRGASIR